MKFNTSIVQTRVPSPLGTIAIVAAPDAIDPARMYRVATTDYLARAAAGSREFFAGLTAETPGLRVRDEVRKYFAVQ